MPLAHCLAASVLRLLHALRLGCSLPDPAHLLHPAACSHSGFSRVSSYLSNSNCFLHIDDCLREEQGPLFGGVLVHKQKLLRRLMGG